MLARCVVASISAIVVTACGSTSVTQLTGPGEVACSVTTATPQQTLASVGDRVSLMVNAARDCLWNASVNVGWLQVSPATGQGDAAVVVTASQNAAGDPRIATLAINGTAVTIVQAGTPASTTIPPATPTPGDPTPDPTAPPSQPPTTPPATPPTSPPPTTPVCSPIVTPTSAAWDSKGGSGQIVITVANGCAWSAVSSGGFITITSARSGSGNGTITYDVQEQKGKGNRSGTLSVAGITIAVTQTGR